MGISHGFALRWTFLPDNFKLIYDVLKFEQISMIHCCGQFMDLIMPAVFFSKILKIPSVLSIHTRVEHTNPVYNFILWDIDSTIVRLLVNTFNKIIALDKPCYEYIQERYLVEDKFIEKIVTGVRMPKVKPAKKEKIILSVSHITNLKDPSQLIATIPIISKLFPDVKLKLIGKVCNTAPFELMERLHLKDQVEFTGSIPYSEVEDWYSKSIIEAHDLNLGLGIGSSALEAMAAGLCVFSAARPDNFWEFSPVSEREIIYVHKNDANYLQSALLVVMRSNKYAQIGRNARAYVQKHFSWDRIGEKFEALYKGLTHET
jgi:glycosyltransferase involved in cell wall biosynthesis